jgi:hypothetical protein
MLKFSAILLAVAASFPTAALAESCAEELAARPGDDLMATVTTMNNRGVASYSSSPLRYVPPRTFFGFPQGPGTWRSVPRPLAAQLFSDRMVQGQPFVVGRADRITMSITQEASPVIVVTLASWGNAQLTFSASCSANGIIHGTSGNSDIVIHVVPLPPPG